VVLVFVFLLAFGLKTHASTSCQDAQTLTPEPLPNWTYMNNLSKDDFKITPEHAEVTYQTRSADNSMQTAGITISKTDPNGNFLRQIWGDSDIRSTLLEAGPFGYPVMKGSMVTLIGDYYVRVGGKGTDKSEYFSLIIECAIKSAMIDDSIDLNTLTISN